jgi:DNA-binding winged helix-turn-helix (wHTH) protein
MQNIGYLINKKVRFHPFENLLYPDDINAHQVKLFAPVSDILLYLINNKNKIVSLDEITHHVWGEKNSYVSPNTLYQNISLLRKALKTSGLNEGIVKTVPRKGFTLAESVIITSFEIDNSLETSIEKKFNAPHKHLNIYKNSKTIKCKKFTIILALLITTITLSAIYYINIKNAKKVNTPVFFSNYATLSDIDNCHFMAIPKHIKTRNAELIKIIEKEKENCKNSEQRFITLSDTNSMWTIINCDKKKNYCDVDFHK